MKTKFLIATAFFSVLTFALALQNFYSFYPVSKPGIVNAQSAKSKAEAACKPNGDKRLLKLQNEVGNAYANPYDTCVSAYTAAYSGESQGSVCDKQPIKSTPGHNELCKKIYDYTKDKATDPDEEADTECKKYDGKLIPQSYCVKGIQQQKAGKSKDDACGNIKTKENKEACEDGFEIAKAAAGANNNKEQLDCDTKFSSPLSWIVCPIIDLGVSVTDFMFKDFIQPLLENVPVGTGQDEGAYKAWQQFRLLANILLIGSLMAIVYSQAKGGK